MGIDWHSARFLIGCADSGVNFERTLTLGRQQLFVSTETIDNLFQERRKFSKIGGLTNDEHLPHADGFLRLLGANELVFMDASPYEGASLLHDLNTPLDSGADAVRVARGRFDVVLDGGTLEHVFNFPIAIGNAMQMVKPGGYLILLTPANNFLGHGFYQFSPELFYRVLTEENGFHLERMIAVEYFPGSQWYEVSDPADVGARVELIGAGHRLNLMVRARRISDVEPLRKFPQQSDYQSAWKSATKRANHKVNGVMRAVAPTQPKSMLKGFQGSLRRGMKRLLGKWATKVSQRIWSRGDFRDNRRLFLDAQPNVFRPVKD